MLHKTRTFFCNHVLFCFYYRKQARMPHFHPRPPRCYTCFIATAVHSPAHGEAPSLKHGSEPLQAEKRHGWSFLPANCSSLSPMASTRIFSIRGTWQLIYEFWQTVMSSLRRVGHGVYELASSQCYFFVKVILFCHRGAFLFCP